jgi:transcriptional regulator with GAF, ATPase, and Fis domain
MNDLPPYLFLKEESVRKVKEGKIPLMKMVTDLERRWIFNKLKESDWNQGKASKLLGITRKMLTSRIKKYNIRTPQNRLSRA